MLVRFGWAGLKALGGDEEEREALDARRDDAMSLAGDRAGQARRGRAPARRFDGTLAAVQQRLKPGNLAGEAWDGVKDKSADLADGALRGGEEAARRGFAGARRLRLVPRPRAAQAGGRRGLFRGEDEDDGIEPDEARVERDGATSTRREKE